MRGLAHDIKILLTDLNYNYLLLTIIFSVSHTVLCIVDQRAQWRSHGTWDPPPLARKKENKGRKKERNDFYATDAI